MPTKRRSCGPRWSYNCHKESYRIFAIILKMKCFSPTDGASPLGGGELGTCGQLECAAIRYQRADDAALPMPSASCVGDGLHQ